MTWADRPASGRCRCRPAKTVAYRSPRTGRRTSTRCHDAAARGLVNDDELRDAIERLPPLQYLAASYWERWLGALELLVVEKGVP